MHHIHGRLGAFFTGQKPERVLDIHEKAQLLVNDPELWSELKKELVKNHVVTNFAAEHVLCKFINDKRINYNSTSCSDNMLQRFATTFLRKDKQAKPDFERKKKNSSDTSFGFKSKTFIDEKQPREGDIQTYRGDNNNRTQVKSIFSAQRVHMKDKKVYSKQSNLYMMMEQAVRIAN